MKRSRVVLASAVTALALAAAACGGTALAGRASGGHGQPALAEVPRLHDALPASVRRAGVLRIATDASYAPASSFAQDGRTIVGFEPDLAEALGQVLGVRVRMSNHPFATLPALVTSHRTDLVMSAMTDTHERQETLDFVDYFTAGTSIVVQRGNPQGIFDLSSLCGHRVAVQRATVEVDLVAAQQRNCGTRPITVEEFAANTDAQLQVRTGRDDALLDDYPPAVALVTGTRTSPYYQLASTTQYDPAPYGIAVAKDAPQLRGAVAKALEVLVRDGRYRQVLARWHVSSGALTAVTIDGGVS